LKAKSLRGFWSKKNERLMSPTASSSYRSIRLLA
jgi:hypothetical protein